MAGTTKLAIGKTFLRDKTETTPDFIKTEATVKVNPDELMKIIKGLKAQENQKYGPQLVFRFQVLDGREGPYAKFYIDAYDHPEIEKMATEAAASAPSPF